MSTGIPTKSSRSEGRWASISAARNWFRRQMSSHGSREQHTMSAASDRAIGASSLVTD